MTRPPAAPGASPIETVVVDGLALAQKIRGQLAEEIGGLVEAGRRPDDLAAAAYLTGSILKIDGGIL